jgi:hypothetical protein
MFNLISGPGQATRSGAAERPSSRHIQARALFAVERGA